MGPRTIVYNVYYDSGRFVELEMPLRPKMRPKLSFGGRITITLLHFGSKMGCAAVSSTSLLGVINLTLHESIH